MAPLVEIRPAQGIALQVLEGEVAYEEVQRSMVELLEHPDFHPGLRHLIDCRRVRSRSHRDAEGLASLVLRHAVRLKGERIAFLAADEDHAHVLHACREMLEGVLRVGVFTRESEAMRWLEQA